MRENKIKASHYNEFWVNFTPNQHLQKMVLAKTELTDKVVERLGTFLEQPKCGLIDLDISKNGITDFGLKNLIASLKINHSLKFLNLSGNKIKDLGLVDLVDFLSVNTKLEELSLGGNIISNEGLVVLAGFLPRN
jgi:Ran GTPase-activating protein (RanGAP) involved in mRNA processing and transport